MLNQVSLGSYGPSPPKQNSLIISLGQTKCLSKHPSVYVRLCGVLSGDVVAAAEASEGSVLSCVVVAKRTEVWSAREVAFKAGTASHDRPTVSCDRVQPCVQL